MSSADVSAIIEDQLNVCHWRNWNLHKLFKLAHECNASIDGTHLKEMALHIPAHLRITNSSTSNGLI
jgi:hypothetical protein